MTRLIVLGPAGHRKLLLLYTLPIFSSTSTPLPPSLKTSPTAANCELQEQMESLSCQWLEESFQSVIGSNVRQENQITGAEEERKARIEVLTSLGNQVDW